MERILCAAIWYKEIPVIKKMEANTLPVNCNKGLVFCGHRHTHCMYTMISVTGLRSVEPEVGEYEQGFLTSHNRFVDREEAYNIASEQRQLNEFAHTPGTLYSEDLY